MPPATTEIKAEDISYNYVYEQPYSNAWNYQSDYNYTADPTTCYNGTSVDAANIIRTMRSNPGAELGTDLGCRVPPQHCYVDNNVVFDMMGKYPSQHATM